MYKKLKVTFHSLFSIVLTATMLAATPLQAQAEVSITDDWQFDAQVYIWSADFAGEMGEGLPFDVPFDTLVDNLDMGFYGEFEARKGKWLVLADAVYLNVTFDNSSDYTFDNPIATRPPIPVTVNSSMNLRGWVFNLVGGYNLVAKDNSRLDVIAGARYMDFGSDFSLKVDIVEPGNTQSFDIPLSTALDAIVGVKGQYGFTDRWSIPYYLDIGAGDSDLTWQAITGISYQPVNWVDVALTYRHMEWDVKSNDGLIKNVNLSGPAVGATFHF